MREAKSGLPSGAVCLAELQSAGRGRSNRPWLSPFASNLYLSLLWRFELGAAQLSGISLAAGVAVVQALEMLGATNVGLKWPNDLLWQERKLGGILLEFGGNANNACYVVTGVGLNVKMPATVQTAIDQPWTDLNNILGPEQISRNRLAACVLDQIVTAYVDIERNGFISLAELWRRYDLAANRKVALRLPSTIVTGIARGIDTTGALL
jgi:BirA family biotin operon repressor/biotin-[acetyl-CoA-carboxylase] ligase